MEKIQLTVNRDLIPSEFNWLRREFKKGETLYIFIGHTYGCIGNGGIACSPDGKTPFIELPGLLLSIEHNKKSYSIFMTSNDVFYAKSADGKLLACITGTNYPYLLEIQPDQLPSQT